MRKSAKLSVVDSNGVSKWHLKDDRTITIGDFDAVGQVEITFLSPTAQASTQEIAEPRNGKARRFDPAGFPCFGSEDPIHESKLAA